MEVVRYVISAGVNAIECQVVASDRRRAAVGSSADVGHSLDVEVSRDVMLSGPEVSQLEKGAWEQGGDIIDFSVALGDGEGGGGSMQS